MSVYQEQARRRLALRRKIEEIGEPELLGMLEHNDYMEMNECGWHEISAEWAVEARKLVPPDFDFGHGCPSCTITRVLMHLVAQQEAT